MDRIDAIKILFHQIYCSLAVHEFILLLRCHWNGNGLDWIGRCQFGEYRDAIDSSLCDDSLSFRFSFDETSAIGLSSPTRIVIMTLIISYHHILWHPGNNGRQSGDDNESTFRIGLPLLVTFVREPISKFHETCALRRHTHQ